MGLAMNAFVGFTSLPLRIASFLGLFMSFMSFSFAILFIINRLIPQFRIYGYNVGENPGTATLAVLISFTSGMLFFCMGIIGEYVALGIREIKRRPTAIIADRIGTKGAHPTEGGVLVAEKLEPIPASS
jgi:dolichol-phosphate mannosyltransferase